MLMEVIDKEMNDHKKIVNQIILNEMKQVFEYDYSVMSISSLEESTVLINLFLNDYTLSYRQIEELTKLGYRIRSITSKNKLDDLHRYINHNDRVSNNNYLFVELDVNFMNKLDKYSESVDELIEQFEDNNSLLDKVKESIESIILDDVFSNTIKKDQLKSMSRIVNFRVNTDNELNKVILEYNIYHNGTFIFSHSEIRRLIDFIRNQYSLSRVRSVEINEQVLIFNVNSVV